jgi:tetratricopeptide (TPR) repeat protein
MLQAERIGRYVIQRRVGRGGMGTLYLAQDPVLDRLVALKLFLGDLELPDARDRFVREARSAAALNHPNIVTIYDYGEYSSQPYIVMEFIQGETLSDVIRRKAPFSTATRLRWITELCAGVGYAHSGGIIHRDIKPANLMVDAYGRLKVLDFGIARMRGTLASNGTALIGTPGYMAPEQIRGGAIDHRSDLFSIGVVCYELMSHAEAFSGETMHMITHRILEEDPVPLAQICPAVDPELDRVVWKALQKDTNARFQDAESLREAIDAIRRRVEAAEPESVIGAPALKPASGTADRAGTGGARRRLHEAAPDVAAAPVPTPSPDRKRTDREALARRRTTQIAEALDLTRQHLDAGDLDAAQESCEQALTLDEGHSEALELFGAIKAERDKLDASDLFAHARSQLQRGALGPAADLLQQGRALDPVNPEGGRLERDLRLERVAQERLRKRTDNLRRAVKAAEDALAQGDLEEGLGHAREALEIDPDSEAARALEEEALQRIDDETGPQAAHGVPAPSFAEATVVGPSPRRSGPIASRPRAGVPAAAANEEPSVRLPAMRIPAVWPASFTARGRTIANSVASAIAVLAVAVAGWLVSRGASSPPVLVVIDATPWASVSSVQRDTGERAALPSPASTPLAMRLVPGRYKVSLVGPPPASETRVVDLNVEPGKPIDFPTQRFAAMTPEEYFAPFLGSAVSHAPGTSPATDAVAPQPRAPEARQ